MVVGDKPSASAKFLRHVWLPLELTPDRGVFASAGPAGPELPHSNRSGLDFRESGTEYYGLSKATTGPPAFVSKPHRPTDKVLSQTRRETFGNGRPARSDLLTGVQTGLEYRVPTDPWQKKLGPFRREQKHRAKDIAL